MDNMPSQLVCLVGPLLFLLALAWGAHAPGRSHSRAHETGEAKAPAASGPSEDAERILELWRGGKNVWEIAQIAGVSGSQVYAVIQQWGPTCL